MVPGNGADRVAAVGRPEAGEQASTAASRIDVRSLGDRAGQRSQDAPVQTMPETLLTRSLKIEDMEVKGVRPVELGTEDLVRIGIIVTDEEHVGRTMWLAYPENSSGATRQLALSARGMVDLPEDRRPEQPDLAPLAPCLITDDLGARRASITDDSGDSTLTARMKEALRTGDVEALRALEALIAERAAEHERETDARIRAGRLVPILVRTGGEVDSSGRHWRPDYIVWFEPTPELLRRLPDAVRTQLENEIGIADAGSPSGNRVTWRPYLDELRSVAGAVMESSVVPNPAHSGATLRFTLRETRVVTVSIHDITGRRLRELSPGTTRGTGVTELPVDLAGIDAGVYLIVIGTDKGEHAVQRLVVAD